MRRLALVVALTLVGWKAAESCGPWYVLRASLDSVFWQPYAKSVPELLGQPRRASAAPVFAGMRAGGGTGLADARLAYRDLARWRAAHFEPWKSEAASFLPQAVTAARTAAERALAAGPSAAEVEELRLVAAKISLREGESLLLASSAKGAPATTAPQDALRRARAELTAFLKDARTPALASEARGWLARCHYLLGEYHAAARIYLDELDRKDSVLDRATLLVSLRIVFPYNGSAARLADHLDKYFDTPRHALFALDLVTNPVLEDEDERRAMAKVGRKALDALERHRELFTRGEDSDALAIALMRASLYMGDPERALRFGDALPPSSVARSRAEFSWMAGVAHFLLEHYEAAEPELAAVSRDVGAPGRARDLAWLGLLAVYQKLDRPTDQLLTAFRYEAAQRRRGWDVVDKQGPWYVGPWPYVGSLMDLSYLLDVQLTEEQLRAARPLLAKEASLKFEIQTSWVTRTVSALYVLDYALAVRAARREDYDEAAAIYRRLGVRTRGARMARLATLHAAARDDAPQRYAYAAFLADHSEQVFFNDVLWGGLQRYAFLSGDRQRGPADVLTEPERAVLSEAERRMKDAQEERWRAFQLLDEIAREQGPTELGRRATIKAIECLDQINWDRFGREAEITAAQARLVASLRKRPS